MTDLTPPPAASLPAYLTPVDIASLELALRLVHADPSRTEQIEWKLRDDGWLEAAEFASYVSQCDALNLSAEMPPCYVHDVEEVLSGPNDCAWHWGAHKAARLVKQMAAAGISCFHPDPLGALAEAAKPK